MSRTPLLLATIAVVALTSLGPAGCSRQKPGPPPAPRTGGSSVPAASHPARLATTSAAASGPASGRTEAQAAEPASSPGPTRVDMADVVLQVLPGATLRIHRLRGTLEPTREDRIPSFEDHDSFRIRVDSGEVALDAASLAAVLNGYVFAAPKSPLSDLRIHTEGHALVQEGKLHKKVTLPFEVKGEMAIARDGRLRLHPTAVRAADVPVKKMLDLFDLEMSELLHLDGRRGLTAQGDDLYLDPSRMLPPPAIEGHPAHVEVGHDEVLLTFGEPGRREKREKGAPGYMHFRGGSLRFGRLTMRDTDLRLTDADPHDPFHFSLDRYNEQLVAGYSKNTPEGGLRVTMPDLEDATRSDGRRADLRP